MSNDNPAEMSNSDLEQDMQQRNEKAKQSGDQEHVNKSTAAEGVLKTPEEDQATQYENHVGGLPDPEGEMDWEDEDLKDKSSG